MLLKSDSMQGTEGMSIVQVLLNVLFPDWLQTALLTLLLLFVINKTVRKGIRQWRQESKAIQQKRQDAEQACPDSLAVGVALPHKAAIVGHRHAGVRTLAEHSAREHSNPADTHMIFIQQTCRLLPKERLLPYA